MAIALILLYFSACKHQPEAPLPDTGNPSDTTNTGGSTSIPCDPDTVYYAEVKAILQANCFHSGCHNAQDKADGVDLSSYSRIMQTADVRPGNAGSSDLYEVLIETDLDKRMPRPPYDALSTEEIQKIRDWINQGAKNNRCDGCDTTDVKYSNQVLSILSTHCINCHKSSLQSGGVNLEGYANVKARVDNGDLLGVIRHESGYIPMPYQGGKLEDCKIRAVELWIENGAKND